MNKSRTNEPRTWREGRRLRGWELLQEGWSVGRVADALGVTHGAVSQWRKRASREGPSALRSRKLPGRKARLSGPQLAQLPTLLHKGAEAWGFTGQRWTQARVGAVIHREFGVQYHPAHVSRVLARVGWTLQKPVRRSRQRHEAEVAQWREETQPELEKRGLSQARPSSSSTRPGSNCCPP
jgi:transposase